MLLRHSSVNNDSYEYRLYVGDINLWRIFIYKLLILCMQNDFCFITKIDLTYCSLKVYFNSIKKFNIFSVEKALKSILLVLFIFFKAFDLRLKTFRTHIICFVNLRFAEYNTSCHLNYS